MRDIGIGDTRNQKVVLIDKVFIVKYVLILLFAIFMVIESVEAAESAPNEEAKTTVEDNQSDPFGRDTPRGTVQGFMQALAANDTLLASKYLNLSPSDNPNEIVRQFKQALDTGGRIQTDLQISNLPEGDLNDRLPNNQDKVGMINTNDVSINLIVERVTKDSGQKYWKFSSDTLSTLPSLVANAQPSLVDRYTFNSLKGRKLFGYDLADMMAVFLLTLTCFILTYISVLLLFWVLKFLYPLVRKKAFPINDKVVLPVAVIMMALILSEVMVFAGVSVTVREPVNRIKDILLWFSLTWLLVRVIDAIFSRAEGISYRKNYTERVSILGLLKKLVKSLLLIFATIMVFGNLGFDLTTGIAALGVGGLALALGAQKAIENLVGSVVVVADRPVSVGDYCKFGAYEGTVIDIGIRSTRVRTPTRTVVTIPNGDFSSMQIENYASRDMFLFKHYLYIKRTASINTITQLVTGMTEFITNHELSNQEWNQAHIFELRQDCYVIEVRAYVYANGTADFYKKQDKLIIDMLNKVDEYDVEHAMPTQQLIIESRK